MTVIPFVGKHRTGKTLHMTIMAYNDYKNGYQIFSNYKLMFPHQYLTVYEMLRITMTDNDRNNKTLCIQEADKIFDSRSAMRGQNKLLTSLTGQSGKRNLNIYYDGQFWNRFDSGLRYVTEYVCSCSVLIDNRTK